MKDKIIGFTILAAIIIGFMWASEVGPFAKEYPPMNPYSGSFEPSFTGHIVISRNPRDPPRELSFRPTD